MRLAAPRRHLQRHRLADLVARRVREELEHRRSRAPVVAGLDRLVEVLGPEPGREPLHALERHLLLALGLLPVLGSRRDAVAAADDADLPLHPGMHDAEVAERAGSLE